MITRQQIGATALGYVNTPFKMAGRSHKGIDCVGLPLCLARDLRAAGWETLWADPDVMRYAKVRPQGFLRGKLSSFVDQGILRRIPVDQLQYGDMVLRWAGFGCDHHVSIILEDDWIVEASNVAEPKYPNGRVVKTRVSGGYRDRVFLSGYQFAEVV